MQKKLLSVSIIAGLSIFVALLIQTQNSSNLEPTSKEGEFHSSSSQPLDASPNNETASTFEAATLISESGKEITKNEAIEMLLWQQERGYPALDASGNPAPSDYEQYTDATLGEMVKGGDKKAMQTLGERFRNAGNFDMAETLFFEAAVRGNTKSLIDIANIYISKTHQKSNTPLSNTTDLATAAIWLRVAVLRGDIQANFLIKMYKLNDVKFEQMDIDALAKKLYNKLAQERLNQGLGEFDNSTPLAIKKLYSQM